MDFASLFCNRQICFFCFWQSYVRLVTKRKSAILFFRFGNQVDQLTFQRSNMEITFMPKRRANSLNFLERFRGKFSRVDRVGGIQGVLEGHSHRYDTLEDSRLPLKPPSSCTIQHHSGHSRAKRSTYISIDASRRSNTKGSQGQKKRGAVLNKERNCSSNLGNKENVDDSNLMKSQLFLPRLNPKSIANSKHSNRIKSRILCRKQAKVAQDSLLETRVIHKHTISRNSEECS